MTHTICDVVQRGMCIGCGACDVATAGAVQVSLGRYGIYEARLNEAEKGALSTASSVCPFSDDAMDETAIAAEVFDASHTQYAPGIGQYLQIFAGRRSSEAELVDSSSGGLTSWLLQEMLQEGLIDGVLHVGQGSAEELFTYRVSTSPEELEQHRKSIYFATTLKDVLRAVQGDGRRYALVGVPCYLKSARLLARLDPLIHDQLRFFVGIVCGHLKSQFFAEALSWQLGVPPSDIETVDFRVKDPAAPANRYSFAVTPRATPGQPLQAKSASLLGGDWGMGLFQPEACNFCDDIFAETADVVFGDAWIDRFTNDWRGTNLVTTRNPLLHVLFENGQTKQEIELFDLTIEEAITSQAGNFRHRRDGLAVRLQDDIDHGLSVPRKRVPPDRHAVTRRRRRVVRLRRALSDASLRDFAEARASGDYELFEQGMRSLLRRYRSMTVPRHRRALAWARRTAKRETLHLRQARASLKGWSRP